MSMDSVEVDPHNISPLLQNLDSLSLSHRQSLFSLRATSRQTALLQAKLDDAKAQFRDAEVDLIKAQAVKSSKEARHTALKDAIASAKTRVEDLNSRIQEKRIKNSEYAQFLTQHSPLAPQGTINGSNEQKDEMEEAISWYNTVLGFHVEGGDGVKFTFKNINVVNPKAECFFTVRHENDAYALLNCEPSIKGTKKFIDELNKANGLYKFVRVMRRKFREAVTPGSASSLSGSRIKKNVNKFQPSGGDKSLKKQTLKRGAISAALSPGSASSVRQSPRLKARK